MSSRKRGPGEFCWVNMITPNVAEAQQFFSRLLGWQFADMPGMGHLILVDGARIGGMFDQKHPNTPPGTKPQLGVMVKVTDAQTMADRVNKLGGKAQPPMSVGPQGTMVVCHDQSGANFDLWMAANDDASPIDGAVKGAFSWFEVLSLDSKRDRKFYADLFGWEVGVMNLPGDMEYVTFSQAGAQIAGMMPRTPDMAMVPPWWAVYFTTLDIDATAKDVVTLGGKLFIPVMQIPNVGRFCGVISPQGVYFYAIQYDRR